MNEKKKEARIKSLMTTLNPLYAEKWKNLIYFPYVRERLNLYQELERLTKGMNRVEMINQWLICFGAIEKANYNTMPSPEYKDNKTYKNHGTGHGSNANKIRFPKKARKTAWKRFYRLFPSLNPENKEK